MKCLQVSIGDSLKYAWAHHIQRLMVIGNFSLLAGLHPDEVDAWYLGVYADALEWVEITNTRGMSQFADGGVIASKPYVSSGQYIHGMSNYCQACHYQIKEKTGAKACPFNSLYWDFFDRHQDKLEKNPRIGMAYVTWKKMKPEQKQALLDRARWVKENLIAL
jgi:deoxyribodipyrimidine photolyase-related protein